MREEISKGNVWFGMDGNAVPRRKKHLADAGSGMTPETLWRAEDVGTTKAAKAHLLSMFPDDTVFDTPKPEGLVKRILDIATDPGDLVLDAFLGSGTTAAVAHKMGRRYIGIDSSTESFDYAVKRMRSVVDGEQGGISPEVGWNGGGGFETYSDGDNTSDL